MRKNRKIRTRLSTVTLVAIAVLFVTLLLLMASAVVSAQDEETPPPYKGLKNPLSWDDATSQAAGKKTYQQLCLGCHGVGGAGLPTSDFSKIENRRHLEERPDHNFWLLSEGRISQGMPGYKSSLAEEQRWQVLTYIWSLAGASAIPTTPTPPSIEGASLTLTAPITGTAGEEMIFTAVLKDKEGKPVSGADVEFFANVNFLTGGLMKLGAATTDSQGAAALRFTPRFDGTVTIVARFQTTETTSSLTLDPAGKTFYEPEIGIHFPGSDKDIFVGPPSALQLDEMDSAPGPALRIPGDILNGLLITAAILALIWFTYFRVWRQVLHIPVVDPDADTNTRLVPMLAIGFVIILGIILVLMFITGPYSYWSVAH
ncbi:MAG: c-type cytochrome [Dehalococcoidia bacterium]|nr:c-type cytochrome [Dehalococcoidia bacterium]